MSKSGQASEETPGAQAVPGGGRPAERLGKRGVDMRILVADDEPITRMDIIGMLEEKGLQVVGEAGDGFDAVQMCRQHGPDVVLMDVKMPVFDGLTAAEKIIQEELAACVILLTAFNDRETIERAKRIGVTGYLVKPVEERLLLPTMEVALAQSRRLCQSRRETELAKRQLSESRAVQQAKGILARREGISESQAYQLLRQMAMDKRVELSALAHTLLDQERRSSDVPFVKERLMREKGLSEAAAFKRIAERAGALGCSREEAARRMRREMEGGS